MKKRNVRKHFLLSEDEAERLATNARKSCMSEGKFIRYLINGINPIEVLPKDFHTDMERFNIIGREVEQITRLALERGSVDMRDIVFLREMKKTIDRYYEEIIDKIMAPRHFSVPSYEIIDDR
ncbi:MAG: hypothetical protein K5750_00215 [Eubacterium sp.]|nr:hypothetical protein [Eubacterium sp.]